jgi:hypothetical protein
MPSSSAVAASCPIQEASYLLVEEACHRGASFHLAVGVVVGDPQTSLLLEEEEVEEEAH